jgi:rRNA processing protein Krr1/Pno1
VGKIGDQFQNKWGGDIENVIKDVQKDVLDELDDVNVSIKVDTNGDSVEINTSVKKQDRSQELEELEKDNTLSNDTLEKQK